MSRQDDARDRAQDDGVAQVFLTRFNLPTEGPESGIRAREGWLRARWELFNRYTLPSMRAQSDRRFTWLVYFDAGSPEWLRRANQFLEQERLYTPLYRSEAPREQVLADIRRHAPKRPELLTTNLDNDDGLARDFVERLRAHRPPDARSAVYFTRGLIRSGDAVYLRTDRNNAFCSVREPWADPLTCWVDWHVLLSKHMAVSEVTGPPAWLQLVHGTNVSNRVHGRRDRPARYCERFPGLIDDVPAPSVSARVLDRSLLQPGRALRDSTRAALKAILMRFGGKRTLDRVKTLMTRSRSGQARRSIGGAA